MVSICFFFFSNLKSDASLVPVCISLGLTGVFQPRGPRIDFESTVILTRIKNNEYIFLSNFVN